MLEVNRNSYIDATRLDDLVADLFSFNGSIKAFYQALTKRQKENLLLEACRYIETKDYAGIPLRSTQFLSFPRLIGVSNKRYEYTYLHSSYIKNDIANMPADIEIAQAILCISMWNALMGVNASKFLINKIYMQELAQKEQILEEFLESVKKRA